MSMFDYDARPVSPVPVVVGTAASRGGYAIRDFLSRNGYPFEWVDAGRPAAPPAWCRIAAGPAAGRRLRGWDGVHRRTVRRHGDTRAGGAVGQWRRVAPPGRARGR